MQVRIAIIGVSHWHTPLFLAPLLEAGESVVGVSDSDLVAADRYANRLGCKSYQSYADLCDAQKPDFVFAMAPHAEMAAVADFLIEAGIPFAIEKPVGINEAQVAALAAKAADRGSFVAIPFVFRYSGFLQTLRDVAAGEMVHFASFRFIAGLPSRYDEAGCSWMLDPAKSGGGSGINLGVHFLDLCQLLLGDFDPHVVTAFATNATGGRPVEDHSVISLEAAGRPWIVETGYLLPAPVGVFDMHFSVRTDGHYFVARGPGEIDVFDLSGAKKTIAATTTNMPHYPTFVTDTLSRLQAGQQPIANLNDMRAVMRHIDAAYRLSRPAKTS
ncbi:Gfo/Idh/MocA family oxidoreductase [Mesorhizobium sp. B2-6-1]|uniref:Gfo/Idh/MocA family protein n=1 Tax=Mesorhizobium sp. B2-6-1 TaxID=2589916 RepID=UPI001AEEED83|nr:Gfo/Idh/MocA family oxidoreductase [Mesorhizobium sp. B2-6-1]